MLKYMLFFFDKIRYFLTNKTGDGKLGVKNFPIYKSGLKTHSFYWDLLDKLGLENNRPFHRLCSLMRKMKAESYIIEKLEAKEEIKEEIKSLNIYFNNTKGKAEILKITFFSESFENDLIEKLPENSCLCFATFIKYKNKKFDGEVLYLYESVICHPKIKGSDTFLLNNYFNTGRNYKVDVLGKKDFIIFGTYFCEQNSLTSVCGHSALKMIVNSLDNSFLKCEEKLTTSKINSKLEIDHKGKKASEGLNTEDVRTVLKEYGLNIIMGDFFEEGADRDFIQFLHSVIESGPALFSFVTKTDLHIIPVIGHTLNTDSWHPEANFGYVGPEATTYNFGATSNSFKYLPSYKWIDHFIIHDDNYGMYYCMGSTCLQKITLPSYDPLMRVHTILGICPEKLFTSPNIIEQNGAFVIGSTIRKIYKNNQLQWGKKLYEVCSSQDLNEFLVLRTLLRNKEDYIRHLSGLEDHKENKISSETIEMANYLPEKFWIIEYTLPNLYTANKSKLGEATFYYNIKSTDIDPDDPSKLMISFRGPGNFLIRENANDDLFLCNDKETIVNHCSLLRNMENFSSFEW